MSRWVSSRRFIIRYVKLKLSHMQTLLKYYKYTEVQVCIWNSQQHFHYFSIQLKICKSNVFYFPQGNVLALKKWGTPQRFCMPKRTRLASVSQFVQPCYVIQIHFLSASKPEPQCTCNILIK